MRISGGVIGLAGALGATAGLIVVALAVDEGRGRGTRDGIAAERLHDAAGAEPHRHQARAPLPPNLRSLPAEDVHIESTADGRQLRFASALANIGIGPLEVRPDDGGICPPRQRHAAQVIYGDRAGDGRFRRGKDGIIATFPAGCMLDHPTHKHWHFDAMARYALTKPGTSTPIASQEKVSFCLRDSREAPEGLGPTRRHYGDCGQNKVQGISPGWADVYRANLPGQMLELADEFADGQYCLHAVADPLGLLHETDEGDNAAVRSIRITGNEVRSGDRAACVVQ
jgi:Lysyl oxidase